MKRLALAALVLAACSSGTQPAARDSASSFAVYYNNDNVGYLDPCGCRVSPIGSMHRRWNAMAARRPEERVFVDSGNTFFKSLNPPEHLREQWQEQALGVVEAYNLLRADALTPGESDFALGTAKLLELRAKAKFDFLSANIVKRENGALLFPPRKIVQRAGKKIGVFGLYSPALALPAELTAKPVNAAAAEQVAQLKREGAELIIALSHQGFEADKTLAAAVPGIDLIVGAYSQSLLQDPVEVGNTSIVQLSSQGQMLGYVEYASREGRLKPVRQVVAELGADFDSSPDPKLANPMKNLVAVTNLRIAEANRRLDEKLWAAHEAQGVSGPETFLSCRECHTTQAKFQEGQLHAAAFLTLAAKGQENNKECLKCHSVGMGESGGFAGLKQAIQKAEGAPLDHKKILAAAGLAKIAAEGRDYRANPSQVRPEVARWIEALKRSGAKKAFVGVQCENCHGTLAGHPFGDLDARHKKPAAQLCVQCHTQSQMPAWYTPDGALKANAVEAAMKTVACPR